MVQETGDTRKPGKEEWRGFKEEASPGSLPGGWDRSVSGTWEPELQLASPSSGW